MKVHCRKCDKMIHPSMVAVSAPDLFTRTTTVTVWCHGGKQALSISDVMSDAMYGTATLSAFVSPVPIVIDRDRGDEDPNEPWQGDSCQM